MLLYVLLLLAFDAAWRVPVIMAAAWLVRVTAFRRVPARRAVDRSIAICALLWFFLFFRNRITDQYSHSISDFVMGYLWSLLPFLFSRFILRALVGRRREGEL